VNEIYRPESLQTRPRLRLGMFGSRSMRITFCSSSTMAACSGWGNWISASVLLRRNFGRGSRPSIPTGWRRWKQIRRERGILSGTASKAEPPSRPGRSGSASASGGGEAHPAYA